MNNPNVAIPTNQVAGWTSTSDKPINQALLEGAKALLQAVYTYNADAPDYLPGSYSAFKANLTSYVTHASHPTYVSWMGQSNGLTWTCEPTVNNGQPVPFSGTVNAVETGANVAQCFTDCSGFITSLFAYVNKIKAVPTKFDSWEAGKVVPEAGCFDLTDYPNYDHPNPANYYRFITQPNEGGQFAEVSLSNVEPGDILVYANPPKNQTGHYADTGHIMLVTAVMDCSDESQPGLMVKQVVVIDETGSPHTQDTRPVTGTGEDKTGTGIGMGIVKLTSSASGDLHFYWSVGEAIPPEQGNITLGRAL